MSTMTRLVEFTLSGEPFPVRIPARGWITEELVAELVQLVAAPEDIYVQVFPHYYQGPARKLVDLVVNVRSQRVNVQMKLLRGINATKR
jgi:hypothetical protein